MHRTRHPRGLRRTQPAFLLVSVLALLALACVPALAQAETVYELPEKDLPEEAKPVNHGKPHGNAKNNSESESSAGSSAASPGGGSDGGNGDGSGQGNASKGNGANGTGNGEGTGQGNPGTGSSKGSGTVNGQGSQAAVGEGEPVGGSNNASGGGGSSSPLVPILIAIAVLAAISIGAVVYRQRRGRPGSPVSPKAS